MASLIPLLIELLLGVAFGLALLWLRGRRRPEAVSADDADRRRWRRWDDHCAAHMRGMAGSTVITPPGPRITVAELGSMSRKWNDRYGS